MKIIRKLITLSLVLIFLMPLAATPAQAYALVSVQVGESRIAFGDNTPVIDGNGRTLVPLAKIASALNMRTNWESETKTVTFTLDYWVYDYPFSDPEKGKLMDATFTFQIDNPILVYEQTWENLNQPETTRVTMDTAPRILASRTYAPVRYLAEAAGYEVNWDEVTRTVVLNLAGTDRPTVTAAQPGKNWSVSDIGRKYSNYWFDFTVNSIWSGEEYNGFRADPGYKFYVFGVTETNTFQEALPMYAADFYIVGDERTNRYEPIYMPGDQFMPIAFTLEKKQSVTYFVAFEIPDYSTTQNLDFCYAEHAEGNYFRNEYVVDVY